MCKAITKARDGYRKHAFGGAERVTTLQPGVMFEVCVMVDGGAAAGLAVPSVTSQVQLMHLQIVCAAWKHPK